MILSCITSRKGQGVLLKKQAETKGQSIGGSRGDSIVENKKQQDMKLKNLPDNDQDSILNK